MSKKVFFYMILGLIGVGIILLIRGLLLGALGAVSVSWLHSGLVILINFATTAIVLFIVFFFLLYWWSDRKWTKIKKKFQKKFRK